MPFEDMLRCLDNFAALSVKGPRFAYPRFFLLVSIFFCLYFLICFFVKLKQHNVTINSNFIKKLIKKVKKKEMLKKGVGSIIRAMAHSLTDTTSNRLLFEVRFVFLTFFNYF